MASKTHRTKASIHWLGCVFTLLACVAMGACTPDRTRYSHFEIQPGMVWHSDRPVRFSPVWSDSTASYSLVLTVRHTQEYPYSTLPATIDLIGESGQVVRHRVKVPITDGFGNWLGQGFGTLYQCHATVAHGITASQARRVVVWQTADSCSSLPGVSDIGLTLVAEK